MKEIFIDITRSLLDVKLRPKQFIYSQHLLIRSHRDQTLIIELDKGKDKLLDDLCTNAKTDSSSKVHKEHGHTDMWQLTTDSSSKVHKEHGHTDMWQLTT